MKSFTATTVAIVAAAVSVGAQQPHITTYLPSNAPKTTEEGQVGTNQCGTGSSQSSMCQNAYINSVEDFCLWAPPNTDGHNSTIGATERIEVAWCTKAGYGTRLIPDGTITGAHFVQTPDYVQVTGVGDLTSLNIPKGDAGGELDPHGADGNGNPVGGLVFSSAFGQLQQIAEWTNFMSDSQFCFRACNGPNAATNCQHIYDEMGCKWNMPANYDTGFENCLGDSTQPMGIYVNNGATSTWHQGEPVTPAAHPIPSSSSCKKVSTVSNGFSLTSSVASTSAATPAATKAPSSSGSTRPSGTAANAAASGSSNPAGRVVAGIASVALAAVVAGAALL